MEVMMLAFVFVVFVAMFATAGTFLSIEAKRRGDGSAEGSMQAPGGESLERAGLDRD
jgi:hypothetical protein